MKKLASSITKSINMPSLIVITFCLLIVTIMTSCHGKHMRIDYDVQSEKGMSDENNAVKINTDSIESANKLISQSITLKEHRVYYVDYSWSMISGSNRNANGTGSTLLKLVQDSLKKSIREIKGEDVDIEIIPFLDADLWDKGQPNENEIFKITKKSCFNSSELEAMDAFVNGIVAKKREEKVKTKDGRYTEHYNTHHSIVIKDFLSHRINNDKQYHMMILLTDGEDESDKDSLPLGVNVLDSEWKSKTQNKYVFGIFSNVLKNGEIQGELPKRFKDGRERRLYYKQGLDFNFNIFILKDIKPIEIRKDSVARIPFGGKSPEFLHNVQEDSDGYYRYTLEQPTDTSSYLKIFIETKKQPRPNTYVYDFKCKYNQSDNSNLIPSHQTIRLTVIDEKTPNIKFWLAGQSKDSIPCVVQEMEYCKKLFGYFNPEWSDTITFKFKYEKSNDAKYRNDFNKIKLSVANLPKYVKLLSKKEIYLDKPSDTISMTFTLDPSIDELSGKMDFESYLCITGTDSLKAIYVNNMPLNKVITSSKIGIFKIRVEKCCHPLLIAFICLLLGIFVAIVITWLIFWMHRFFSPRFPKDASIKFHLCDIKGMDPNINMFPCSPYNNINLVSKGEVFSPKETSNVLLTCNLREKFVDRIVIATQQQEISSPKRFTREWFSREWNGDTIYVQGIFNDYSINEIIITLKGTRAKPSTEITLSDGGGENTKVGTLHLYKLARQGEEAITINKSIQLVAYKPAKIDTEMQS